MIQSPIRFAQPNLMVEDKDLTCGSLAVGAVGSHSLPVATPRSPHRGRPSSADRGLRADHRSSAELGPLDLFLVLRKSAWLQKYLFKSERAHYFVKAIKYLKQV